VARAEVFSQDLLSVFGWSTALLSNGMQPTLSSKGIMGDSVGSLVGDLEGLALNGTVGLSVGTFVSDDEGWLVAWVAKRFSRSSWLRSSNEGTHSNDVLSRGGPQRQKFAKQHSPIVLPQSSDVTHFSNCA